MLIVVAIVLSAASGCAWTGQQKAEDLRADSILKQSADQYKQRGWQWVDGGIGP